MTNLPFLLISAVLGALVVIGIGWLARWLSGLVVPVSVCPYTGFAFVLGGWGATGISSRQAAPEMAIYAGGLVGLVVVWWWFFNRGATTGAGTGGETERADADAPER